MTAGQPALDVAALYAAHAASLHRYFHRRLPDADKHLAEDLVAATFERVVSRAHRYTEQGNPHGWLVTVAHHLLIDHLRHQGATTLPLDAAIWHTVADAGADHHTTALDLAAVLASLNPDHRAVLEARYLRDLSTRATAETLGRSEDAIKKLLTRALDAARRALARAGSEPTEAPWSVRHPRCIECGRTVIPHAANGRCNTCYARGRRVAS